MKKLWEEEKGLELEKRGSGSSWDRGRNCQGGGKTDIWTGRERGEGGCRRDGGTEGWKKEGKEERGHQRSLCLPILVSKFK